MYILQNWLVTRTFGLYFMTANRPIIISTSFTHRLVHRIPSSWQPHASHLHPNPSHYKCLPGGGYSIVLVLAGMARCCCSGISIVLIVLFVRTSTESCLIRVYYGVFSIVLMSRCFKVENGKTEIRPGEDNAKIRNKFQILAIKIQEFLSIFPHQN